MIFLLFSALVTTATLIYILRGSRIGQVFLDVPTARGLHVTPVPRIGGIAIFASVWLFAGVWMQRDLVAGIAGLSLVLVTISLLDDLRPLSAVLRLLVHTGAAILVLLLWVNTFGLSSARASVSMGWALSPPVAVVLAVALMLTIVWMTNLYNFMDGADGLAGGMSVIGFGAYTVALGMIPNSGGSLGLLVAALTGATAGFLIFNFPPAKVFMGDAGSIPLGFLSIALGIHGAMQEVWPVWFAPLIFSPFIVDASATLLRRLLQGHKPWVAHRDNYYQRLILSGWSHRKTALVYYGLMLVAAGSALGAMRSPAPDAILLSWVIIYVLLLVVIEWRLHEKKNKKSKNNDREAT